MTTRTGSETWLTAAGFPAATSCSNRPCGPRPSRARERWSRPRPGRAREGTEHPVLGGLQLRPGARPVPQREGRHGQGRIAHQRSHHDQPPARGRNQCLGPDQRQQSLGPQGDVPREADQASRPRALRALLRQDDAGLQAALQMGDGRVGRRTPRHGAALWALQLRRQHRQDQPRHGRGPGLEPVERPGQCRQVRHPRVG